MDLSSITFSFFLIFSGAAVFASIALYTRQPLIIAYIALGACIGPYGLSLVTDLKLLWDIGHVGIIFLLFLLGLDMQPQALLVERCVTPPWWLCSARRCLWPQATRLRGCSDLPRWTR